MSYLYNTMANKNITQISLEDDIEYNKNFKSKYNKNLEITNTDDEIDEIDETDEENTDEIEETADECDEYDNFENYIVKDSIKKYNNKAIFCHYLWNGTEFIDRWELQRKIDENHAKKLICSMEKDYKKYKEFIFYEPIHLGKINNNDNYKIIDGQHRLESYQYLLETNKYSIQKIPCIIWNLENEKDFIKLFDKINSRISINKNKLIQYKMCDVIKLLEETYSNDIWGRNRPRINKELFIDKMRENNNVHNLDAVDIITKIKNINNNIRSLSRKKKM